MSYLKVNKEKNKRWIRPDGLHHLEGYWCVYITRGSSTKMTDNKNNSSKFKSVAWEGRYANKNGHRRRNKI